MYGFTSPPIFSILLNNLPLEVEEGEEVEPHVTQEQQLRLGESNIQGSNRFMAGLVEGARIPLHQGPGWKSAACM